jgi:hypothetical protein
MNKIVFAAAAVLALGTAALAPTSASAGGYGYNSGYSYGYQTYRPSYQPRYNYDYGYNTYVAPRQYIYVAPKRHYNSYNSYDSYTYGGGY